MKRFSEFRSNKVSLMFIEIVEGVCLLILGLGIFAFGLWLSKSEKSLGRNIQCYGKVINICDNTMNVSYTIAGIDYTATVEDEMRAKIDSLPPEGTKVSIIVSPESPETPIYIGYKRQMGRGYGSKRAYQDNSPKANIKASVLVGTLFLLGGIHQLLRALSII